MNKKKHSLRNSYLFHHRRQAEQFVQMLIENGIGEGQIAFQKTKIFLENIERTKDFAYEAFKSYFQYVLDGLPFCVIFAMATGFFLAIAIHFFLYEFFLVNLYTTMGFSIVTAFILNFPLSFYHYYTHDNQDRDLGRLLITVEAVSHREINFIQEIFHKIKTQDNLP